MNIIAILVLFLLYIWSIYSIPILAVGVKDLRRRGRKTERASRSSEKKLPTFSIIVAAKDEEKVVGRLLKVLLRLALFSVDSFYDLKSLEA